MYHIAKVSIQRYIVIRYRALIHAVRCGGGHKTMGSMHTMVGMRGGGGRGDAQPYIIQMEGSTNSIHSINAIYIYNPSITI